VLGGLDTTSDYYAHQKVRRNFSVRGDTLSIYLYIFLPSKPAVDSYLKRGEERERYYNCHFFSRKGAILFEEEMRGSGFVFV
jgi:hypothetical protein